MLVGQVGKVVVVNVWASWCAPCRAEAPLLERASKAYGQDVAIIGVASRDTLEAARDFVHEFGLTYPNVFDGSGAIAERLSLRGFPTTYIVGRDGRVVASVMGGITEQRLAAQVQDTATGMIDGGLLASFVIVIALLAVCSLGSSTASATGRAPRRLDPAAHRRVADRTRHGHRARRSSRSVAPA